MPSKQNTAFKLNEDQLGALDRLKPGSVLVGGVGSGKTITSLAFYKKYYSDLPLVVITTPKNRDDGNFSKDGLKIGVKDFTVDSWNNIAKYKYVKQSFFIFDEQRVVGTGKWASTFIHITKNNTWILLSATPGDTWMDYRTIFIANNFFRNIKDFNTRHVVFSPYVKFPLVMRYINESELHRYLRDILVIMKDKRTTVRNRKFITTDFSRDLYNILLKDRWNYNTASPIENVSELTYLLRTNISTSPDRLKKLLDVLETTNKVIIFYNFILERDCIVKLLEDSNIIYFEYNGSRHDPLPNGDRWVYLVQYSSAEGWNCITTNNIIFYSPHYSWRVTEQAEGRIDRINTPFKYLNYIYFCSRDCIEDDIFKAIEGKKTFNERTWMNAKRKQIPENSDKKY